MEIKTKLRLGLASVVLGAVISIPGAKDLAENLNYVSQSRNNQINQVYCGNPEIINRPNQSAYRTLKDYLLALGIALDVVGFGIVLSSGASSGERNPKKKYDGKSKYNVSAKGFSYKRRVYEIG